MALTNSIESVVKYYAQYLDEVYAFRSVTEILRKSDSSKAAITLDSRTIKYPKMLLTGRSGYNRFGSGNTNSKGAINVSWETHALDFERYAALPLDKLDNIQGAGVALGNAAKQQIRTVIVPEDDTYVLSTLATKYTNTLFGNRKEDIAITSANVLDKLAELVAWFRNHGIQDGEYVAFISADVMTAISKADGITRMLTPIQAGEKVSYEIYDYLGLKLIVTPQDRLYTLCNLVADPKADGCTPTVNSKLINILGVEINAPVVKRLLDYTKVFDSTETGGNYIEGFIGYLLVSLEVGCCFVPDNRQYGIFASVSATDANTAVSIVNVSAVKGTNVGDTLIENIGTTPNGIFYDAIYNNAAAVAVGSNVAGTQVYVGTSFAPVAANSYILLAKDGKVVATSGQIALPKKA